MPAQHANWLNERIHGRHVNMMRWCDDDTYEWNWRKELKNVMVLTMTAATYVCGDYFGDYLKLEKGMIWIENTRDNVDNESTRGKDKWAKKGRRIMHVRQPPTDDIDEMRERQMDKGDDSQGERQHGRQRPMMHSCERTEQRERQKSAATTDYAKQTTTCSRT